MIFGEFVKSRVFTSTLLAGTILLDQGDDGITLMSYGGGRAVIDGAEGSSLKATGCHGLTVKNLLFTGLGRKEGNEADDGGGFDLDGGATNSILQYNLSYNNNGPGDVISGDAARGRFENNLYWPTDGQTLRFDAYATIRAWAEATGQEKIDHQIVGRCLDPRMTKAGDSMPTEPRRLSDLAAYQLRDGSLCLGAGVPIEDNGGADFWSKMVAPRRACPLLGPTRNRSWKGDRMKRKAVTAVVACLTTLGFTGLLRGDARKQALAPGRPMLIGVDYYPEHWSRDRWETDVKLMKDAGFNVVRLAEFAWIDMEPEEGQFEFGWLDDAVKLLAQHDMYVILGTPTAVMPAWVARKYPETLRMQADGTRVVWGGRKHNCYSSGTYRMLSERITRAMAEHFAQTPNVIGWQIDNEFGGEACHCGSCRAEFQDWLRNKYGSLDELNRAWGNQFWGLKFTTWGEITIPDDATDRAWVMGNPSACLDWKRFITWQQARFQADQARIVRDVCPDDFITHNFMGLFSSLDYYEMAKDLDFVSWDNYPIWSDKPNIPYDSSLAADVMRGLKQRNFLIMEQTAGPCGWESFGRNPWPGEIRKIAYQQLAHGSDGQIWFRWRTCTVGREQYWHGLLGHDGKPLRRYQEAAQTAREFRKLESRLRGTTVVSEVALVYDYDNLWSLSFQPGFAGNSLQAALRRYYHALMRAGINVDVVNRQADLSQYKLVLTPDLSIMPDETARKLNAYVKNGGVLLADCRTGVKDERNLCHERTLPGLLTPALGIIIEEYSSLGADTSYKIAVKDGPGTAYTAIQYTDWVTPQTAKIIADYPDQWHLKPFAAVTRNAYGKGKGWYVGTVAREDGFYDDLIRRLLDDAGIKPVVSPPAGVEASLRQGQGRKLLFLMNHTDEPKTVSVPQGKVELLRDRKTGGSITLDRFGVVVLAL